MKLRKKHKNFPFCPEDKIFPQDKLTPYMNENKRKTCTSNGKLFFDWSDQKDYLFQYKMLKFYVKHGMILEKIQKIISFKQSKWLEKFKSSLLKKAKNAFEKVFYKLLRTAFYRKTMENLRNRIKIDFMKKEYFEKFIQQQSELISMEYINLI